jgi:hypothetical protein
MVAIMAVLVLRQAVPIPMLSLCFEMLDAVLPQPALTDLSWLWKPLCTAEQDAHSICAATPGVLNVSSHRAVSGTERGLAPNHLQNPDA